MNEDIELINNTTDKHNLGKVGYSYVVSKKISGSINSNSLTWMIITGRRGIGKSSYCLYVLYDMFLNMGYTKDESWDKALEHCLFTISEIISFLKNTDKDKAKFFCWDDAGVGASNLKFFSHLKEVSVLQSLMDTIRTSTNGVLINCPSEFQLLKFLRRYDGYTVQITYDEPKGHWYRVAKGYMKYTLPSGKTLVFHKFNDYFYCRLPTAVYNKYMKKREDYNIQNIRSLETLIQKKGGEKCRS